MEKEMQKISTQQVNKNRITAAIEAQKLERLKNLRLMLSKGLISKEEFDQKTNAKV